MDTHINFGLKIRELVQRQPGTIEEEAKKLGYTRTGLIKVLEKPDVNTQLLRKLCSVYNVDMSYFLNGGININQKGNANIGGSGSVQYKGENNIMNESNNKLQMLESENKHLKKQIQLLEDMVQLLRGKT